MKMNQNGTTMIIVIIFVLAFIIMGSTMYNLTSTRINSALYSSRVTQSITAAESGIEDALQIFKDNGYWPGDITDKKLDNCYYSVSISSPVGDIYTVTALGRIPSPGIFSRNSAHKRIIMQYKVVINSYDFDNVLAGEDLHIHADTLLSGTTYEGDLTKLGLPPIISADYMAKADVGGTVGSVTMQDTSIGPLHIQGDLTLQGNITLTGPLYIDGTLRMGGTATVMTGKAPIYVVGGILIQHNVTINPGPLIVSATLDKATIQHDISMAETIIYLPNAIITFQHDASLTGAIVCKDINIQDNASLTWAKCPDITPFGGGTVESITKVNNAFHELW